MYKLLLILKYLRRRLAPMFAALAVMLCTAMVIIVISVMGGFLQMMRSAARTLSGDVVIRADLTGFPYYGEIIDELDRLPEVAAATAMITTYGLIHLDGSVQTVKVHGIDPNSFSAVTGYRDTLYWSSDDAIAAMKKYAPEPDKLDPEMRAILDKHAAPYRQHELRDLAMRFEPLSEWGDKPGLVMGIEVSRSSLRDPEGKYHFINSSVGQSMTLTVVPLSSMGVEAGAPSRMPMIVVNEFKSGLYPIDAGVVYVPFNLLQQKLLMTEAPLVDYETGKPTGETAPARATEIMIKGEAGVPLDKLRRAVAAVRDRVDQAHDDFPPTLVATWEQEHGMLLSAVEHEKGLLTILFAIISVVAVAMIGVIFYMIVLEKTRDIGVLRALGASRGGIAGIFLGYGLTIGILGAGLGFALAAAVVWNLNEIQELLYRFFGFQMWNPQTYYFDRIPDRMDAAEVTVILIFAVVASVVGALIPAWRASRVDPVESLRYE